MNITFCCPVCDTTSRRQFDANSAALTCADCACEFPIPKGALDERTVCRCLVCPSTELFVRKAFPQRLGVAIIVVGLAASCIPWYFGWWYSTYAILFATALLDAVLYLLTGNLLQCYRCHCEYRDVPGLDDHSAFDLETYERHRQQVARLQPSKPSPASGEPANR